MKENNRAEVERILKLVQEGKLDAKDAVDLIEALEGKEQQEQAESSDSTTETEDVKDFFGRVVDSIESASKEVATAVQWDDVKQQVKDNFERGMTSLRKAAEEAKKGNSPFSSVFGAKSEAGFDLPLAVPKGKTLKIEIASGNIKVDVSGKPGSIAGTATFRAYAEEDAKMKAKAFTPLLQETESTIIFQVPDTNDVSVDVQAHLMDGCPIEIVSRTGDIEVVGTESSCRVEGAHGSVKLRDVGGVVNVALSSGDVEVAESACDQITVHTKSGDINLKDVSAVTNLRTSSGSINVSSQASNAASLETASGDIVVAYQEPYEAALNARTVSGDIDIAIPLESDCRVNISTLNGSVGTQIELQEMRQEHMTISGKLGDGSGTIDASAVQGDITITETPAQ